MATSSVTYSEQAQATIARANALFTERIDDFRYDPALRVWFAPSATVEGRFYAVRLSPVERCECASFEHHGGPCKHILSVKYLKARTGTCSNCGTRVLWRFLTEVDPEHELLAWFVGDRLCADCIHGGAWA
jgi:SWIM zinc finger